MRVPSARRTATERFGPPAARRAAVRLVRLQYEYQYDCGFLKSVELTVAGRESSVFSWGSVVCVYVRRVAFVLKLSTTHHVAVINVIANTPGEECQGHADGRCVRNRCVRR